MNALDLADELEAAPYYTFFEGEAAIMLRQQHAEIESLKAEKIESVMEVYCTCYRLGYSPTNNFTKVKTNEDKNKIT